jgi:hypothetical protein
MALMAWIKVLKAERRRIRPKPTGIVTSVIDYRPGMVVNVPRDYAEDAIARGVAEATDSPAREGSDNAATAPSGSSDSAAIDARSRRRRER